MACSWSRGWECSWGSVLQSPAIVTTWFRISVMQFFLGPVYMLHRRKSKQAECKGIFFYLWLSKSDLVLLVLTWGSGTTSFGVCCVWSLWLADCWIGAQTTHRSHRLHSARRDRRRTETQFAVDSGPHRHHSLALREFASLDRLTAWASGSGEAQIEGTMNRIVIIFLIITRHTWT